MSKACNWVGVSRTEYKKEGVAELCGGIHELWRIFTGQFTATGTALTLAKTAIAYATGDTTAALGSLVSTVASQAHLAAQPPAARMVRAPAAAQAPRHEAATESRAVPRSLCALARGTARPQ